MQLRLYGRFVEIENRELAELLARVETGERLTPVDEIQLAGYYQYAFLAWQYEFVEWKEGRLTDEELPVEGWRLAMDNDADSPSPRLRDEWESYKVQLRSDFVEFIDDEVLGD